MFGGSLQRFFSGAKDGSPCEKTRKINEDLSQTVGSPDAIAASDRGRRMRFLREMPRSAARPG